MGGFEVNREEVAGGVILRLSGTLDVAAAHVLKTVLGELDRTTHVIVDFSQVREFHDLSLSVLARTLSQHPMQLRGLRTHQERMLEYFGVPTGESKRASEASEEQLSV
jgi:anti-anti-sigma regulatory factor